MTDPAGTWNSYRVDWGCDSITWLVNGKQVWRLSKSQIDVWTFNQPFYLLLNLAVGGNWPGNTVDTSGGDMLVDYVKVYVQGAAVMPPSPAPSPAPPAVAPSPAPATASPSSSPAPLSTAGLTPAPGTCNA